MVWKDCFERELYRGEDIIVGIVNDYGNVELHSGIVIELNDNSVLISYNGWYENGEEFTVEKQYTAEENGGSGIIMEIFKIYN